MEKSKKKRIHSAASRQAPATGLLDKMNEALLQFIWQFQYFNTSDLLTTEGESVQVIHGGNPNSHQGPDFSDAKIKIGNTLWAGTVELHVRSSLWHQHGHGTDANYDNVILHVVWEHDMDKFHLPVLELKGRVSSLLLSRYMGLMQSSSFVPCEQMIESVRELQWQSWKDRLLAERLLKKSGKVIQIMEENLGHWEVSLWWMLARNFGVPVNADAFEAVARSLPITILTRHKNNLYQLEALLMGQARLLEGRFRDEYPKMLQKEYAFLKKKYKLVPIVLPMHFLRMRPGNFPTIRLAQLAALIHESTQLFSRLVETGTVREARKWFSLFASDYWHYHYRFDEVSVFKTKRTGAAFMDSIVINTLVPVLFAYGCYHQMQEYKDKALSWLEKTTAEKNNITAGFLEAGIAARNAFDTQALAELKTAYCEKKRCLECAVGNSILQR